MAINSTPDIHELVICANVFIKKDDKFLVLKRSKLKKYAPNVIHPVGGKVDLNENPFEAAIREAKEETGISIENLNLRAVLLEIIPRSNEPNNWVIYHFIGDYKAGDLIETEEGELLWLTPEEVRQADLFPSVHNIIDHILDLSKSTIFVTNTYGGHESNILESKQYYCK
jgi:8-oxo-dGTP diphosphatase